MNVDESLANIDKLLAELEESTKTETYNSNDSLREDINDDPYVQLNKLISEYQITKNIELLDKCLELIKKLPPLEQKQCLLQQLENGQNLLEEISNYKLNIDYTLNIRILEDPELTKILIQTKNKDAFIYAGEKNMLMEIDGITVVEHLLKANLFQDYWVSKVSKSPLMIELLFKYNRKASLSNLSEEQLFTQYEDGTLLDYLFKNGLVTSSTMYKISSNPEIYNYIIKYKTYDKLSEISESLLTKQINGKYMLDLIIENNQIPHIRNLYEEGLLDLIIERNRLDLLADVSSSTLSSQIKKENKTLFEYLLDNGVVAKEGISSITNGYGRDDTFFSILEKKNRLDLLSKCNENALLKKYGDKTLYEILVEKNITIEPFTISNIELVNLIYNSGRIELLQGCKEDLLLTKLPTGKTIIQELIERNLTNLRVNLQDYDLVKYIFDNSIYQLYKRITTSSLLRMKDLNTTFLEQVLEESKTNGEIEITNLIDDAVWNPKEHAQARIIYALKDMHMFLAPLTKKDLLEKRNGVRLIDELLSINPSIAIEKVIPPREKADIEIAMIIKLNGGKQDDIRFESITEKIEDEYLNSQRREFESIKLSEEQEQLLSKLQMLMNDGQGEPALISTLIASYRYLLSIGSIHTNEIYHLINIKLNDSQFTYKHISDGAYFSSGKKAVCMDDTNMDTLNHETGHALFHYMTDSKLPEGYEELISRLRENPKVLQKMAEYSKKFYALKEQIEETIEITFMKKYDESITEEKRQEIQQFINNLNQQEKQKYINLGYSEDVLDVILGEIYTVDEYIAQDRKIKKKNMVDLILRTQYGPFTSIGDYYDGIYKGRYKGGILIDEQGEKILPTYGHGIEYYSRGIEWVFNEMIANYSAISKSKEREQGIEMLKEYVGEELVNMIEEYYLKQIILSTKLEHTKEIAL